MQKRNRFWWIIPFTIGILLWGVWSVVFSSTPLKAGSKAPDFMLTGSDGNAYRLSDFQGKRVVLMFYPKSNTPGCTAQNCAVRDQYEKLSQHAVVLGISVDTPEAQANFAKQHNLKHIVLADADGKVAEAYGVRTTAGFASRTTFVIAPDGSIEKVFEKAGTSTHAEELLGYFNASTQQGTAPAAEKPEIGKRVPNFTLPNMNAREGLPKEVTLYDIKDKKAIVIIFIATRCPVSLDYDERMANLAKEYADKGVLFLGINSNHIEPASEVTEHAKQKGFTFPVLKDEGNKVADMYAARVTPEVFVLDSNFTLRYHGRIDDSQNPNRVSQRDLKNALDAILAGKEPPVTETRAFGCTIKRVQR
ncbi:MAG: redoxin domain-containing protein [Fimbriimonadales bacterium]|nr:redoxin domain-containing protein [Fimbriimonadales bacterium]